MKKILVMLLVLLGLGMAACSLEGFGGGNNNNKPEHKHSIVEGWKNDSANHWQLCDSCDEKLNLAAHEFSEWEKVEGLDLEIRSCLCGWEEQRNTEPESKDFTVYYYNSLNWETVNAYAWNESGALNGEWPGSVMAAEAEGWYTVTLSVTSLDGVGIIFNNGATQTDDITLASGKVYYYGLNVEGFASKEEALAAYDAEQEVPVVPNTYYLRGSMNGWGTSAPLTVNGDVASIEIEILRTDEFKVACAEWSDKNFGITNGEVAINGGNFKVEKSGLYRVSVINYGTEQETVTIELLKEYQDQVVKNDFYFRGTINSVNHWNTCNETVKFVAGETSATFEVTLAVGDEFKVAVAGDGWTPQYNANNATYEADYIGGTDNFVVKTAGKYKLEITGWGTAEEKLVITLVEASDTPIVPVEKVYTIEINGVSYTLTLDEDATLDTNQTAEYTVTVDSVLKGQTVVVKSNGEAIINIGAHGTGQNVVGNGGEGMSIVNDATNVTVAFKLWQDGGHSLAISGYVAPEIPEEKEELTVYYYNSANWETINAYSWNTSGELLGTWPGSAMTAEENGWYTIKFETGSLEGLGLIFNNGSEKTKDIALDIEKVYFYGINTTGFASKEEALAAYDAEQETPVETTTVYLNPYQWNSNDAWYWVHIWDNDGSANLKMTDEDADGIFEVKVPVNYNKIIFVRANPACTEPKWNNETEKENVWNQSADLDMPADSKVLYIVFSWEEGAWAPLHACDLVDQKDETNHWKFCDECDLSFGIEEHKFENFVSNSDATCTKNGTETATCSCGETKTQDDADSMLNHVAKEAWEKDDNNHWHLCQNCETAVELDKAPHVYGEWVEKEPATETETGLKERSCTCGHIQTEEIPVLAHTHKPSTDYSSDGTYHWLTCSGCSERLSEGKHEGGTATTTEKAVCEVCNTPYGSLLEETPIETHYYLLGTMNSWSAKDDYKLVLNGTSASIKVTLTNGDAFKVAYDDYSKEFGYSSDISLEGKLTGTNGQNIEVAQAGEYTITVSGLDSDTHTLSIVCDKVLENKIEHATYYLVGSLNGENFWNFTGADRILAVENGVASISYKFAANDEFKIAAEGWNPEFGYSNELDSTYFSASGTNIKVNFAGTYLIQVTYSTDGSKDTLTITPGDDVEVLEPAATLYLQPNANWNKDNARFAAYFFGNGEKWVSMTDSDGDGIYEVDVPSGFSKVIFCRMNPGSTTNSWNNKWNQTGDLSVPTDGSNLCTIKEGQWDCGMNVTWSTK